MLLSYLLGAVEAQPFCVPTDNIPGFFNMNEICNFAGSCIAIPNVPTMGTCKCCDPYEEGDAAVCSIAGGWTLGAFYGTGSDVCKRFSHKLSAILSYIVHVTTYDAVSPNVGTAGVWTCNEGPDGVGVSVRNSDGSLTSGYQSSPDMIPLVTALIKNAQEYTQLASGGYENYVGEIVPHKPYSARSNGAYPWDQHCRICRQEPDDCVVVDNGVTHAFGPEDAGGHIMVSFATDFNTYYNSTCAKEHNFIPGGLFDSINSPGCAGYNTDHGQAAEKAFDKAARGADSATAHQSVFLANAKSSTSTAVGTAAFPSMGLGWNSDLAIELFKLTVDSVEQVQSTVFPLPTQAPSPAPTPPPTDEPTSAVDDCFAAGYTHVPTDLQYVGVTSGHCRNGLDASWPGASSTNMCDSPYVICLPQENTPNVGFPLADGTTDLYLDNTTPYSLDQCKKECAYDQRCTGFEFWADTTGQAGYCSLIDDIPVVMGAAASGNQASEADLLLISDWNGIGRICYEKNAPCNPYFGEADLNEVMLKCYCPNNRKGFYTKKVTRTVEATKFCGYDEQEGDAVTKRIKEAQANRMFHLCENWCLFNTQSPRTESWYHDPWNPEGPCWREQYAGVGTHRSYCYRVIRDPFTIEQFFIDTRSANMCGKDGGGNTPTPTYTLDAPTAITYFMALPGDTCADKCAEEGMTCSEDSHDLVAGGANDAAAQAAFMEAGYDCSSTFSEGNYGWAFPGRNTDGTCLLANSNNAAGTYPDQETNHGPALANTCNMSIGANYQRLCSCY